MRLRVSEILSLDGVMEAPDNWVSPYMDQGIGEYVMSVLQETDAMLFGRKTYQEMAAAWPERSGAMADIFNGVPKYVVSTTLSDLAAHLKKKPDMPPAVLKDLDPVFRALVDRMFKDPTFQALMAKKFGLLAAGIQDDLEHVVGYTVVADAGFVVLGLAVLDPSIWEPVRTWILILVVARSALAAWAVAVHGGFGTRRLPELAGWARRAPVLAAGLVGIVTLVLAVAGIVSGTIPAIALIVALLCAWGFSRTVSRR